MYPAAHEGLGSLSSDSLSRALKLVMLHGSKVCELRKSSAMFNCSTLTDHVRLPRQTGDENCSTRAFSSAELELAERLFALRPAMKLLTLALTALGVLQLGG